MGLEEKDQEPDVHRGHQETCHVFCKQNNQMHQADKQFNTGGNNTHYNSHQQINNKKEQSATFIIIDKDGNYHIIDITYYTNASN